MCSGHTIPQARSATRSVGVVLKFACNRQLAEQHDGCSQRLMRGFVSTRGALAALAFACAASVWLHLTGERAIYGSSSAVLGSPAYDMQSVVTPAASGPLLTALTYLLTATPLGPPIRRFLLNDNKVEILRELAAQSNNTPPLYYPMRRVGAAVHEAHAAAASSPDGSLSVALRDGFAPPSTAGDVAAAVPRPRQSSTAAASVYITSEDLHAATPNPDPSFSPNLTLTLTRTRTRTLTLTLAVTLTRTCTRASERARRRQAPWWSGCSRASMRRAPSPRCGPLSRARPPQPRQQGRPRDPNPQPNPNPNPNPQPN